MAKDSGSILPASVPENTEVRPSGKLEPWGVVIWHALEDTSESLGRRDETIGYYVIWRALLTCFKRKATKARKC